LLRNPNVTRCSAKSISYSPAFRVSAVKLQDEGGLTATEIFREAGFDIDVIGRETSHDRLKHWKRIIRRRGWTALAKDSRGRKDGKDDPTSEALTDAEKIKWLEARVAYLKAENDFLIKLRSGKTE
jgi:hypothetical protein